MLCQMFCLSINPLFSHICIVLFSGYRSYWRKSRPSAWFISKKRCLPSLSTQTLLNLVSYCALVLIKQRYLLLSVLFVKVWLYLNTELYGLDDLLAYAPRHLGLALGHRVLLLKLRQIKNIWILGEVTAHAVKNNLNTDTRRCLRNSQLLGYNKSE